MSTSKQPQPIPVATFFRGWGELWDRIVWNFPLFGPYRQRPYDHQFDDTEEDALYE